MASNYVTVSFPPKEEPLFKRIVKSCPKDVGIAEHARNLMRNSLDATCAKPKRK